MPQRLAMSVHICSAHTFNYCVCLYAVGIVRMLLKGYVDFKVRIMIKVVCDVESRLYLHGVVNLIERLHFGVRLRNGFLKKLVAKL